MPEASVGRIVHYISYGTPGGEYGSECRAAIITDAGDRVTVGLAVINPTGLFFNGMCFHDEETRKGGTWHWPERTEG